MHSHVLKKANLIRYPIFVSRRAILLEFCSRSASQVFIKYIVLRQRKTHSWSAVLLLLLVVVVVAVIHVASS